jgi:hypothetical protein
MAAVCSHFLSPTHLIPLILTIPMHIWINNIPLSATYDATSLTSKFFLGRIPALRMLRVLSVYILRITVPLPMIQDPFISDFVLYPANNLSHDVVLGQDWHRLLYQAG